MLATGSIQSRFAKSSVAVSQVEDGVHDAVVLAAIQVACTGGRCGSNVTFADIQVGAIDYDGNYSAYSDPLAHPENQKSTLDRKDYQRACTDCGAVVQLLADTATGAAHRSREVALQWVTEQRSHRVPD